MSNIGSAELATNSHTLLKRIRFSSLVLASLILKVRDVQRMTGAMIKLPEDQATQGEETFVEIFASFMAAMVCISCMFLAIASGRQEHLN